MATQRRTAMRSNAIFSFLILFAVCVVPAANAAVDHVLLISVDGLHASDLTQWIMLRPDSTLAALAGWGTIYPNARTPTPSDSFPGLLALITGGTPASTGVCYDDSYDRTLSAPGSGCKAPPGTEVVFDETIDKNFTLLSGGGGIDPQTLSLDPNAGCTPVYPHSYSKLNNIFEVAKGAGLTTCWTDKHLAYDLVNGPSGTGVVDLYTPEIVVFNATIIDEIIAYDALHTAAILNWVQGLNNNGSAKQPVPAIFGGNYQAVNVAQQQAGYKKDLSFSPGIITALEVVDAAIGAIVNALKANKLDSSTAIIVTAKHGQAPIDSSTLKLVPANLTAIIDAAASGEPAHLVADDIALIWLKNSSNAAAVTNALKGNTSLGVSNIFPGSMLEGNFGAGVGLVQLNNLNASLQSARRPDLVIITDPGVIYTKKHVLAQHGGVLKDDTNVALLVVNPFKPDKSINKETVYTTQVAPTILGFLGLDTKSLDASKQQAGVATIDILSGQISYSG